MGLTAIQPPGGGVTEPLSLVQPNYPDFIVGAGGAAGNESSSVMVTRAPTGKFCWDMFRQDAISGTPSWLLFEAYSSGTTRALIGQLAGYTGGMLFIAQATYGFGFAANGAFSAPQMVLNSTGNVVLTGLLQVNTGANAGTALAVTGPSTYTASLTQTTAGSAGAGISSYIAATGTEGTMGQLALYTTGQKTIELAGASGCAVALNANGFSTSPQVLLDTSGNVTITGVIKKGGVQVVGAQVTGYGTPTGNVQTANFPGATATLLQTAEELAQLITDLKTFGILGA